MYHQKGSKHISLRLNTSDHDGMELIETYVKVKSRLNGWGKISRHKVGFESSYARVRIGISSFDDSYLVYGDERVVLARLNQETRSVLNALPGTKSFPKWHFASPHGFESWGISAEYNELNSSIDQALALSEALDPEEPNDDKALLENVKTGETALNRRLCFAHIIHPQIALEAAEALRQDSDSDNQIVALIALERADDLMAHLAANGPPSEELLKKALTYLTNNDQEKERQIWTQLVTQHDAWCLLGVEKLKTLDVELPFDRIKVLVAHSDKDIRLNGIERLGRHGVEARPLLAELILDSDDDLAAAAIELLVSCGELSEVHPIMDRCDGVLRSTKLKQAGRIAIEAIQTRHGVQADGGLALSPNEQNDEEGRVSLEAAKQGAVSIKNKS